MNQVPDLHSWDVTTAEARDLQLRLASQVDARGPLPSYETIAGADVSYHRRAKWLHAAVVVLRAGTFEVLDRSGVLAEAKFPYVPGLLTFREAPAVIEAYRKLEVRPDILICDGQGIAHPAPHGPGRPSRALPWRAHNWLRKVLVLWRVRRAEP